MEAQLRPYQRAAVNAIMAMPHGELKIARGAGRDAYGLIGGFMDPHVRETFYSREWLEEGGRPGLLDHRLHYMRPEERHMLVLDRIVRTMAARHPSLDLRLGEDMTLPQGRIAGYRRGMTIEIGTDDGKAVFAARGWDRLDELVGLALMHLDDWLWSRRGTPAAASDAPTIAQERIRPLTGMEWESVYPGVSFKHVKHKQWVRPSTAHRA